MAVRKRFNKEEREAFKVGAQVEWLNGSHWHPAIIKRGPMVDTIDQPYYLLENQTTTRTVHAGQVVRGYPGRLRLPI